jgi:sugar/nucleoside kinase (ribokinase family)
MSRYDLVAVGVLSKDRNVVLGKEEVMYGGGAYCGAFAAVNSGFAVAVVTKLAEEDLPGLQALREAGIDVFYTLSPRTTSIKNVYTTPDLDRRTCHMLSMAEPFRVEEFPEKIEASVYQIAALIAGEVPLEVVKYLARKGKVGLDVQGFVRNAVGSDLVSQDWQEKWDALPYIDFLKTDAAEAEILTGKTNRDEAMRALVDMGAKEIILTHSSEVMAYAEGEVYHAEFKARNLSGRTGRGDTCFAAYLTQRLHKSPEEALKYAAALTSLKMETPGPFKGDIQEVEALLAMYESF